MRKRRSIVYVRPGKDVTLYVPADTPVEVIDYLNQLKEDGLFSQGVMEIVTQYVMKQVVHSNSVTPALAELGGLPGDNNDDLEEGVRRESVLSRVDEEDDPLPEISGHSLPESSHSQTDGTRQKLDLAQIFRQAQRNAGKMNLE